MKVVNTNLKAGQSLVDKVWDDAMESAALYCEYRAQALFAGGEGEMDHWNMAAGRQIRKLAEEFRREKRGLK